MRLAIQNEYATSMSKQPVQNTGIRAYDIFVIAVTLLSIANIFLYALAKDETVQYVISTIDVVLSVFFFIDFVRNMARADSKRTYFFKDYGWADLLASLPFPQMKILRVFRLLKAYRLIRIVGVRAVVRDFAKNKATGAVYIVFFMILLLLEFGSIMVLRAEMANPDANIKTASDALWWVYVTITTVGYGDRYPTTNGGRLVGMMVMFMGVGLFAVMTGFLANKFLPTDNDKPLDNSELALVKRELDEIKKMLKEQQ